MPDGGYSDPGSGYFNSNLPWLDPRTAAWAGFAQGFGQAAMPSRAPVPIGAALGMAAGAGQQAESDALKNRLTLGQAREANAEGGIKEQQLAGMKLMQQLNGSGGFNRVSTVTNPGGGFGGNLTPTPAMAAAGVDTSQPGWYLRPGAIDPAKVAAVRAAGGPGLVNPQPIAGGGAGPGPGAQPQQTSSMVPPMWNTHDLMSQANLAASYGLPYASSLFDLAKSTGEQMVSQGAYLGIDNAIHPTPGIDPVRFAKYMSDNGYRQTPGGGWQLDPSIARGKGAIAGAEAQAKVGPETQLERNKADIAAEHDLTPANIRITNLDGSQSDVQVPMSRARQLAIAGGKGPSNLYFAPQFTPANKDVADDQKKTLVDPAQKFLEESQTLSADLNAIKLLARGQRTGLGYEEISNVNNLASTLGIKTGLLDPQHFNPNAAAALQKNMADLIVAKMQAAAASNGGGRTATRLMFQYIEQSKPQLHTPGPALNGIIDNMQRLLGVGQTRASQLLQDRDQTFRQAQPLPQKWEDDFWNSYEAKNPHWQDNLAKRFDALVKAQPMPASPADARDGQSYIRNDGTVGIWHKAQNGFEVLE